MNEIIRKVLLAGIVVVGMASAGVPAQAAAKAQLVVNDGGNDCGTLVAGHTSIQTAANVASMMGQPMTILVCPGIYAPFTVNMANKLTIRAANKKLPPVIAPERGGSTTLVTVTNSLGVTIDGLRLDGTNFDHGLRNLVGIRFNNATGTLQNNTITLLRNDQIDATQVVIGIAVADVSAEDEMATQVTIKNNRIFMVSYAGIFVEGRVQVAISGNTIEGTDSFDLVLPGSSIALRTLASGMPSGSITKNVIRRATRGISLHNVSNFAVKSNQMEDVVTGVYIEAGCHHDTNTASGNTISGNKMAVMAAAMIRTQENSCLAGVDSNVFTRNTFIYKNFLGASVPPNAAIKIQLFDPNRDHALSNRISGNTFKGWPTAVYAPDAPTTIVEKNKVKP